MERWIILFALSLGLAAWPCTHALAEGVESRPTGPMPIRDNSFLVEEAYNQEDGVVQHISSWMRDRETSDWIYTFTQEWPMGGMRHQISYTLPLERSTDATAAGTRGVGDVALNYRFQATGGDASRVAFSPRASLLVPTGDETEGLGSGGTGLQINLPLSIEVTPRLVAHSNAGATRIRAARNSGGDEADVSGYALGQSFIWLLRDRVNLMLEASYTREQVVVGPGRTAWESSMYLAPGLRAAFDRPSGLQIVPGFAALIGAGASRGDGGVFFYLSFEHPFGRSPAPIAAAAIHPAR